MLLFDPLLSTLAAGLDDVEKVKIQQGNRLRQLTRTGEDADGEERGFGLDTDHPVVAALMNQLGVLETLNNEMTKALSKQLKKHPLYPWIKAQKGVGDKTAARLLHAVRDPYWNDFHDRPRTVSELWAFCGLHVIHGPAASQVATGTQPRHGGGSNFPTGQTPLGNQIDLAGGVAPRRQRGQKVNWSTEAKTRTYLIAEACMKQLTKTCVKEEGDSFVFHVDGCACGHYRKVYDAGRIKYVDSTHVSDCVRCGAAGKPALAGSPLSAGHKHARAMRLVMKEVLKDLWVESKRLYETPVAVSS